MEMNRRGVLWSLAALASPLPGVALGQESLLPLKTPGLDHLDVMVPDVEATTRFYMGLFSTNLHAQEFQGGYRYFVLLGKMNERREVGYLAIGDARGRGTYIGHFCTSVFDWRQNTGAIAEEFGRALSAAGFGEFPGFNGFGGLFEDPDGIEIQFLPAPDTLVTAANPSDLVPSNAGLVTPKGLDHVLVHVSDLDRAVEYYSILYGPARWSDDGALALFDFPATETQLQLKQTHYVYGEQIEINHFAIKVDAYDEQAVRDGVAALGGTVLPTPDETGVLRIEDPDGNIVEIKAA